MQALFSGCPCIPLFFFLNGSLVIHNNKKKSNLPNIRQGDLASPLLSAFIVDILCHLQQTGLSQGLVKGA